jgi:uncharacterized protein (TIGR00730 family)
VHSTESAWPLDCSTRNGMANVIAPPPGHRSHLKEFMLLGRTLRTFVSGFTRLHVTGPCVTVFGSARTPESHPHYALGREIGRRLSEAGFTVMTGGGPGLMEAANRGAREAGGPSVACNIKLPVEQAPNRFIDRYVTCHHFFARKVLMFRYSYGFVVLPGGYGTMDEMFEALTLIQTGKIERFPMVLVGLDYWAPLLDFLRVMARERMIDAADLDLLLATDDVQEAVAYIERHAVARFGLRRHRPASAAAPFAPPIKPRSALP